MLEYSVRICSVLGQRVGEQVGFDRQVVGAEQVAIRGGSARLRHVIVDLLDHRALVIIQRTIDALEGIVGRLQELFRRVALLGGFVLVHAGLNRSGGSIRSSAIVYHSLARWVV